MGPKISHIRKTDLGGQLTEFEVTAAVTIFIVFLEGTVTNLAI